MTKTNIEETIDAERSLNEQVNSALGKAKNPPPATLFDGIDYAASKAAENAERQREFLKDKKSE